MLKIAVSLRLTFFVVVRQASFASSHCSQRLRYPPFSVSGVDTRFNGFIFLPILVVCRSFVAGKAVRSGRFQFLMLFREVALSSALQS